MALRKMRGSRSYYADDEGLRQLGQNSKTAAVTIAAARKLAGSAQAAGKGNYEAAPATVTAGWKNERRSGAVVREMTPDVRDARQAILLRVMKAMRGGR
ncbi:hypothetical protein RI444_15430 [Paenarthrobacter sp. AT5]|uniref:hypothetical protein n=1 Tax=Paenarthrobacter TaxID=1742992 RepID=UPI001A98DC57|nr:MULTISPECIES: hypothetical protein [Paenarthrobacter]QSZ53276.1 hypothetical protein AYX19_09840 [Paenarthrobacter ureafaciens]WOC59899.1 hypothetical protein RI444_15430 [Paenarthrobacter sp. AT5]